MIDFKSNKDFNDDEIKKLLEVIDNKSVIQDSENAIQINGYQISAAIENLGDEQQFLDSVYQILQYILNNPVQVLELLNENCIFQLYQGIEINEARTSILLIFSFILRYDPILVTVFTQIIEPNIPYFLKMINFCLNSDENCIKILTIHFLKHLFRFEDACHLYLKNGIFQLINSLLTLDEELDFNISLFYKDILTIPIQSNDSIPFYNEISPVLFHFLNHPNHEMIYNSIDSLYFLFQSIPLPYFDIIQNSHLPTLVQYLDHPNDLKLKRKTIKFLKACYEFDDFPIEVLFEYNIVHILFKNLENNDESFAKSCVSFLRVLIQKCNPEEFLILVDFFSQFDFLSCFPNQSLQVKQDLIEIFIMLCEKSTLELTQKLMTANNIEFLLELLGSSEPSLAENISSLFIHLIQSSEMDESFQAYLYPILNELEYVQQLEELEHQFSEFPQIGIFLKLLKTKFSEIEQL